MTTYIFRTPVIQLKRGGGPLFGRISIPQGISVLRVGGFYQQHRDLDQSLVDSAEVTYIGGHTYTVDSEEAAALTDAGYGAYLDREFTPDPRAYGVGTYGSLDYGG